MKRFIFAALVAAGCLWGISVSAQEPQDEYKKELRAYLETSGSLASFDGMIDQVFAMMAGNLSEEAKADLKTQAVEKLIFYYTPIYKESISLDDLKEINRFYQTPAGTRIAEAQPVITTKATAAGQQWGMWLQGAVQAAASK